MNECKSFTLENWIYVFNQKLHTSITTGTNESFDTVYTKKIRPCVHIAAWNKRTIKMNIYCRGTEI